MAFKSWNGAAAQAGHAQASYNLGVMDQKGDGVANSTQVPRDGCKMAWVRVPI